MCERLIAASGYFALWVWTLKRRAEQQGRFGYTHSTAVWGSITSFLYCSSQFFSSEIR